MNRAKRTTKRQRKAARHLAAVMWRDTLHGRICAYRDEAAAQTVVGLAGLVNEPIAVTSAEQARVLFGHDGYASAFVPPRYAATVALTGDAAGFEREILDRLDGHHE